MPSWNAPSGAGALWDQEHEEDMAQRRLDQAAHAVFGGDSPSEDHVVAAALLHMAFPSVAPERLEEAADLLVKATPQPCDEVDLAELELAATEIADVFATE